MLPRIPEDVFEVILVDGRSTDGTVEVARRLLPDVRVVMERRRGKGNALLSGFRASRGDIIVMLDADGSADPAEIPRFVEALVAGADFAKGSRYLAGRRQRRPDARCASLGNKALTGIGQPRSTAPATPTSATATTPSGRDCLPRIDVDVRRLRGRDACSTSGPPRPGSRSAEVPSFEGVRLYGRSNLNAVRDGLRVLGTVLSGEHVLRPRRRRPAPVVSPPPGALSIDDPRIAADEALSAGTALDPRER